MNLVNITVEDAILIVLNDRNEVRERFPLKEVGNVFSNPFYQALLILKEEQMITTNDDFQPKPLLEDIETFKFYVNNSLGITLKGIHYLRENKQQTKDALIRFAKGLKKQMELLSRESSVAKKYAEDLENMLEKKEHLNKHTHSLISLFSWLADKEKEKKLAVKV